MAKVYKPYVWCRGHFLSLMFRVISLWGLLHFALLFFSSCQNTEYNDLNQRIIPLLNQASSLVESNPDSSILLSNYILRVLDNSDINDSVYVRAEYTKGLAIRKKGFNQKAYDHLNNLYQHVATQRNISLQALVVYRLGYWHYFDNHYFLAKEYLEQALALYRTTNDKLMMADAILYLGISNLNLGNYSDAQRGLFRSKKMFEQLRDSHKLGINYLNIGNLFHENNDNVNALIYYNKSAMEFQKSKDSASMANAFVNIGLIQKRNDNLDSALYYYQLANEFNSSNTRLLTQIINTYNMADVYVMLNKFNEAKIRLDWCLENCLKENITEGIPRIYSCYASIHVKQKEYNKAILLIDSAIIITDSIKMLPLKKQFLEMKRDVLSQIGDETAIQETDYVIKIINDSLTKQAIRDKHAADEQLNIEKKSIQNLKWIKKKEKTDYFDWFKSALLILIPLILLVGFYVNYHQGKS